MSTISNKEAALLGMLSEGPRYPYEIEKEILSRSMRDWTEISMSSVYKVLAKLEEKDLVISEVKLSESNRSQKVYTVTPRGNRIMQGWIKDRISAWERSIWPVDIALSNLSLLSNMEVTDCLTAYIRSINESVRCYQDLLSYLEKNCSFPAHSLARRPMFLLEAEKKWATEMLEHYSAAE